MAVDEVDFKILAKLVENSKASFAEIGECISVHPNVVAYRVKRMEQAEIIKKYTLLLDLEKLGLSEHIYVSASFPGFTERDSLLKEISAIPQVFRVLSTLGAPGLMIFIVGKNKAEINEIISRIRNLNVNIETASPIVKIYQDWLPGYFFQSLAEESPHTAHMPYRPRSIS